MSGFHFLIIAIVCEVIGTSVLKLSEGFTRLIPSVITVICYAISFYFLSQTIKTVPVGIAYAIWSGVGIVLISLAAFIFLGQKIDLMGCLGMAFIIIGVVIINLFSHSF